MPAKHLDLGEPMKLSAWRKISFGMWRSVADPSIYALLEIEVDRALGFLDSVRDRTGTRVTLTHLTIKVVAETLRRHPQLNSLQRLGRLYPRKTIDIFVHAATTDADGEDLSGIVITRADKKSIPEIARELGERAERLRSHRDKDYAGTKAWVGALPGLAAGPVLRVTELLLYTFNVWSSALGVPRNPFGSAMVTSVGSLGIPLAFTPLAPCTRVPVVVSVGAVEERAVVRDRRVAVAKVARVGVTLDHRVVDGVLGGKLARTFQELFSDPGAHPSLASLGQDVRAAAS